MFFFLAACATHDLHAIPAGAAVEPAADVGPHDEAQTEWWHVHARLRDVATGEPLDLFAAFIVQRTDLDRVGLLPVPVGTNPFFAAFTRLATPDAAWTADRQSFPDFFSARLSRDGLDHSHGNWRLREEAGAVVLDAGAGPARTELRMVPTRAPTLPGERGRVRIRGASHLWMQEEGMAVRGRWVENGRTREVEGSAFFKHQWGRLYDPTLDGFEWFSAELPDGRALSVGWLADDGMRGVEGSLAWFATPDGAVEMLDPSTLSITPTRTWRSRRSGATWPVSWTVRGAGMDLVVEAERDDQEIWAFPASIWAGPTRMSGTIDGAPVVFDGFAEQVGADSPALRALFVSDPPPGEVEPAPAPVVVEAEPALVPWALQLGAEVEQ